VIVVARRDGDPDIKPPAARFHSFFSCTPTSMQSGLQRGAVTSSLRVNIHAFFCWAALCLHITISIVVAHTASNLAVFLSFGLWAEVFEPRLTLSQIAIGQFV
jgi:hypothetical protein